MGSPARIAAKVRAPQTQKGVRRTGGLAPDSACEPAQTRNRTATRTEPKRNSRTGRVRLGDVPVRKPPSPKQPSCCRRRQRSKPTGADDDSFDGSSDLSYENKSEIDITQRFPRKHTEPREHFKNELG